MQVVKLNKKVLYNPDDASFRHVAEPTVIILTLDNLETLIFNDLLEANGELVNYETLFSHWGNKIVTDGVLSRVISSLRNKLRKLEINELKVTNVSKKGYKLDGYLERISYVAAESEQVKADKFQRIGLLVTLILTLSVVIGYLAFLIFSTPKDKLSFERFSTILSNDDVKYALAVSPSTNRLAYTTFSSDNRLTQTVYDRTLSRGIEIEDELNSVSGADFVDDDTLLIYSLNDQECTIKQVTLDFETQSYKFNSFAKCSSQVVGKHLSSWRDNEFFYLDGVNNALSSNIYRANLATGELSQVSIDTNELGLAYAVFAAPQCNQIALLSITDNDSTRISIINVDLEEQQAWTHVEPTTLYSLSWDCERLVYKTSSGALMVHTLEDGEIDEGTEIPVLGYFYNPVAIDGGIALIKGSENSSSIVTESKMTSHSLTLANISGKSQPRFWDDSTILFGVEERGEWHLARLDTKQQITAKLPDIVKDSQFENLEVNKELGLIAIQSNKQIDLYRVSDGFTAVELVSSFAGNSPFFFEDKIIYANKMGNTQSLYVRGVDANEETLLVPGGHSVTMKDGELYFDYWSKLGIWKYNEGGDHELYSQLGFESLNFVKSDGELVVKSLHGGYYAVKDGSVEKLDFTKTAQLREIRNGISLGVSMEPEATSVLFAKWR